VFAVPESTRRSGSTCAASTAVRTCASSWKTRRFRKWRRRPPHPRIRLRIADCSNEISLWFELHTPETRENALYKINTLLGALERFRTALDAEAELYEHREQHRRKEVRAR